MSTRLLRGNPPIEITLRRSARARRFSLRVSGVDGRVTLCLPQRAREADALVFAEGHADWIRRALARQAPRVPVLAGAELPVEGQPLTIVHAAVRSPRIEAGTLILPPDPNRAGPHAEAFLRFLARGRLHAASLRHAEALGRPFRRISLRDTRSRWGSCTSDGSLMYSWRLILAPPAVLDYVAAHEVAHLAEMNHGPAFWRTVSRLLPGWQEQRRWLKGRGSQLHRFDFSARGDGADEDG